MCENRTTDNFPDVDIFSYEFEPTINDQHLTNLFENKAQQETTALGTPADSKPICNVTCSHNVSIPDTNVLLSVVSKILVIVILLKFLNQNSGCPMKSSVSSLTF
jgi:hypothetical protein